MLSKSAYVYLIRSQKTQRFYLGWAIDLQRRLEEHNAGVTQSTRAGRPWEYLFFETYANSEFAKQRERALKHHPRQYAQFKNRALNVFWTAKSGPNRMEGIIPPPGSHDDQAVGHVLRSRRQQRIQSSTRAIVALRPRLRRGQNQVVG